MIWSFLAAAAPIASDCKPADPTLIKQFFGLTPWYQYLDGYTDALGRCVPLINDGQAIGLIFLAVADTLIKLAGIVAVGFVIYGGVQYIISQGSPDKTNEAKNTIVNALVGVVIAMIAAGVVSFIGASIK